jgi:hypothetical protein
MSEAAFEGWVIVELFGRRRVAGRGTADGPLLRATRMLIDIYDGDAETPAATQLVSLPAYCVTPCTEATARHLGASTLRDSMPVAQWELPSAAPDPWDAPAIGPGDGDVIEAVIHAEDCTDDGCTGECDA